MLIITAFKRQRQENQEFQVLGHTVSLRPGWLHETLSQMTQDKQMPQLVFTLSSEGFTLAWWRKPVTLHLESRGRITKYSRPF